MLQFVSIINFITSAFDERRSPWPINDLLLIVKQIVASIINRRYVPASDIAKKVLVYISQYKERSHEASTI